MDIISKSARPDAMKARAKRFFDEWVEAVNDAIALGQPQIVIAQVPAMSAGMRTALAAHLNAAFTKAGWVLTITPSGSDVTLAWA